MKSLKIIIILAVTISLFMSLIPGCRPPTATGTLSDDLGREIRLDRAPQRIVSHVPGITEILFALGLEGRVVGVSTYCDYPEAAKLKEKVGGYFDPSVEKIVALRPDIVFTDGYVDYLMPQLDQLKVQYAVLQPKDINGIISNIRLVGWITGTEERAEKLAEDMSRRLSNITGKVQNVSRPRVFYIIDATDLNNPWTGGPGSYIDALITLSGGENIGAKAVAQWAQFSIEEVVSSDPELLIIDAMHGTAVIPREKLEQHPAWQKTTAVRLGKIGVVDGDLVSRSGPRIIQGLEEMAKIIHPELFR